MFLNVITSFFSVIFPKLFREELLGFPVQGRSVVDGLKRLICGF